MKVNQYPLMGVLGGIANEKDVSFSIRGEHAGGKSLFLTATKTTRRTVEVSFISIRTVFGGIVPGVQFISYRVNGSGLREGPRTRICRLIDRHGRQRDKAVIARARREIEWANHAS
jgi:hypothetical protein